jgi:uncharacterized membrane protein
MMKGLPQRDHLVQKELKTANPFDMETLVGYILLIGVLVSVGLIVLGMLWRWINTGSLQFDFTISGMNFFGLMVTEFRQFITSGLRPRLLISLGIIVLLLTPYVRVLASFLYFAFAERNWKYSLFTAFVFSVLTYSLFLR